MIMAQHPSQQHNHNDDCGGGGGGTSTIIINQADSIHGRRDCKQQQQPREQYQAPSSRKQSQARDDKNKIVAKNSMLPPQSHMTTMTKSSVAANAVTSRRLSDDDDDVEPIDQGICTSRQPHSSEGDINNIEKLQIEETPEKQQMHLQQQLQQEQRSGQDSKRTLIKNQLYLIEQLQLENANLRNERDQLQLENEELKFQLQMISSSNILGQSSSFDEQQLEKLVETTPTPTNDERLTKTTKTDDCTTATNDYSNARKCALTTTTSESNLSQGNPGQQAAAAAAAHTAHDDDIRVIMPAQLNRELTTQRATIDNSSSSSSSCYNRSCTSQNTDTTTTTTTTTTTIRATATDDDSNKLTKITATPVRLPLRLMNCDDLTGNRIDRIDFTSSNATLLPDGRSRSASSSHNNGEHFTASLVQRTNLQTSTEQNVQVNGTQFRSANHKPDLVPCSAPAGANNHRYHDEELDDRAQLRLFQRLYGDCDKVQAAAVIIQRAFRKYQICKRFRMITDQLRNTCKPLSPRRKRQAATGADDDDDDGATHDIQDNDNRPEKSSKLSTSRDSVDSSVPFASGATRAAAWESLSQAASRLAESAAAARAKLAPVGESCVNKSRPTNTSLHDNLQSRPMHHATSHTTSSSTTTLTSDSNSSSGGLSTSSSNSLTAAAAIATSTPAAAQSRSNSVVAAALNFQQLESIRKRQYRVGLNIFNKTPEKGISFLIAHSFIDCSPPYSSKTATSFYLSNQLHFIDKQQHLAVAQQQQQQQQQHRSTEARSTERANSDQLNDGPNELAADTRLQDCRFCFEEENLKMNVAHFLLHRKGLAKEKIGQYLGNLQCKFNQDILVYYLKELDFYQMQIDVALRKFSSTLRMPGEAQKIERFVDRFAQRYVECQQQGRATLVSSDDFMASIDAATAAAAVAQPQIHLTNTTNGIRGGQKTATDVNNHLNRSVARHDEHDDIELTNKNNLTRLTKDEIFILTFAIIMLNTDLHSPSLKSTSRMSANQFINNLRGVFKPQTVKESHLLEIYERVKANQITTAPDHVTHVMKVQQGLTTQNFQKKELPNLCVPHRRLVCFCRLFEVYDVNKKERAGQHQREIFLFNDMLLVTKLARRAVRANTPQQYTYRQSILLRGLYVQLFRSTHYSFGIRLCQQSNDETLIMFNARNELDQSRFVDDLNESIAEMDEMETIRVHNIVDTIHFKQQDRLRRHQMMHEEPSNNANDDISKKAACKDVKNDEKVISGRIVEDNELVDSFATSDSCNVTVIQAKSSSLKHRMSSKFSSMSNLASLAEADCENADAENHQSEIKANGGLRQNRSFVHKASSQQQQASRVAANNSHKGSPQRYGKYLVLGGIGGMQRSCSTNSVHSLDSGLFLSRDVSPNQSG